jgi:hypothetical protein
MSFKRVILGGTTLYPTDIATEDVRIADGPERMVNGTLRIWHRAFKKTFKLSWKSLPESLLSAIRAKYRTTASQTYNDESNTNYTVVSIAMSEKLSAEQLSLAGIFYYDVDLELQEV